MNETAGEAFDREFSELYLRAYRRMVVLAFATTRSTSVAEEVVQDAFVDLYRRWGTVLAKDAWLRRAVVSRSTSWLRRHILERQARHEPPAAPEPSSVVELRIMLSVLSPRQRAAVILRYYEDLSEKDISLALRCRPGTVKSLLSRALHRLEEELSHAYTV